MSDDRFKMMFEDAEFKRDVNSHEYKSTHRVSTRSFSSISCLTKVACTRTPSLRISATTTLTTATSSSNNSSKKLKRAP